MDMELKPIADLPAHVAKLSCWSSAVTPQPLTGGITNTNFVVQDGAEKFVVRVGDDLPLHGILRAHELASSRAAHAVGLAPEIIYHERGVLVMRFIEGVTLTAEDFSSKETLDRVIAILHTCHTSLEEHIRGEMPIFDVFEVCQNYIATARRGKSRVLNQLSRLKALNMEFEEAVGTIAPVFCHNDLLPANFIDDGDKLWLVDWEYAGWNATLFDLANLVSNCALSPELEEYLLTTYLEYDPDSQLTKRYHAFKCASLMREALWSVVQELHSHLDFDYAAYSNDYLTRLENAYAAYKA